MLQEKEAQLKELLEEKQELENQIEKIKIKEYGLNLEIRGLIAQHNYGYKCAVFNPDSNMIIKTVIEIHDEEYREIEDFHGNIEFKEYYINDVKFIVNTDNLFRSSIYSGKAILLNYKYEIGNEKKFIFNNEKYRVSRRERGYDRSDIYYSWQIPVEIPFSWVE